MHRLLVILTLLLVAAIAGAQMGATFNSLEAMIGESQTVVAGRIIGITHSEQTGQEKSLELTFQVDELIKGKPAKTIRLSKHHSREEVFRHWQTLKTKLLLFIPRPGASSLYEWHFHPIGEQQPVPEDKRGDMHWYLQYTAMFSMDYRLLDTPELILDAARKFVKKHPGPVKVWRVASYPPFHSPKFPRRGDANVTHLPALPEAKKMAREMIDHPERWVKRFFGPGGYPYDPVYGGELNGPAKKADAVRNLGRSILAATPAGN